MNRTSNPHRGGVPKGTSWTLLADSQFVWGTIHKTPPVRDKFFGRALTIIRDHSRRAATRAEATRLLTLLEAKHG